MAQIADGAPGEPDQDDGNIRLVYLRAVARADHYVEAADAAVRAAVLPGHLWQELMAKCDFADGALSMATFLLQAGVNALLTLRLLTFPDGANGTSLDVAVTINGTAGLIRQTLENAVFAHWLLASKECGELTARGFAAVWEDSDESLRCAGSLRAPDLNARRELHEELRRSGERLGLFARTDDGGFAEQPRLRMSDATGKLTKIDYPAPLSPEILAKEGSGFANAGWVYRWLSGQAHGYSWVHPRVEGATMLHTRPDFPRLVFALQICFVLLDEALAFLAAPPVHADAAISVTE